GEDLVADIAFGDDVVAQPELLVDHRGQRLDPVGVDFGKLLDPAEDIVELGRQPLDLRVGHRDPRELGDVAHLVGGNGHGGRIAAGYRGGNPRPEPPRSENCPRLRAHVIFATRKVRWLCSSSPSSPSAYWPFPRPLLRKSSSPTLRRSLRRPRRTSSKATGTRSNAGPRMCWAAA